MNDKARILRDWARFCISHEKGCDVCALKRIDRSLTFCRERLEKYPEKAVEIIEAWAKEHPEKTYMSNFLEKFPRAQLNDKGIPFICRRYIYGIETKLECKGYCSECWNEPMEG